MKNKSDIIARIEESVKGAPLIEALAKLSQTDFHSVLLHLSELRSANVNADQLINKYEENRLVQKSDISQKQLIELEYLLSTILPESIPLIELPPITVFGNNAAMTRISQKNILSAGSSCEIVGDVTTSLAMEIARARKDLLRLNPKDHTPVCMATNHRSVRLQQFSKESGFTSHFKVFAMCTGGRDRGNEDFVIESMAAHLTLYLDFLKNISLRSSSQNLVVKISDIRITEAVIKKSGVDRNIVCRNTQNPEFDFFKTTGFEAPNESRFLDHRIKAAFGNEFEHYLHGLENIEERLINRLRSRYPDTDFIYDLSRSAGIGYYYGPCFKITATNKNNLIFPLADGGLTDWTQKILSNRKERLLISGLGTELFSRKFLLNQQ